MTAFGLASIKLVFYLLILSEQSAILKIVRSANSCTHVGAGEAYRDPLQSGDLELHRGPMARRARAIDAAAPDPFARLEIGVFVKAFDEAAGVGRDCRFPFGAAPEQSKEHDQLLLNQ
jgi:hypothetical protein